MWMFFYSFFAHIVFALCLPWLLLRAWKTGKLTESLGERFGLLKRPWVDEVAPARPIWIHAVSVGETQMLGPLLAALSQKYPDAPIVVSTNTVPGQMIAGSYCEVSGTFYLPLDFGWAVKRLIAALRPRILLIMETEIWPNLLYQSHKLNLPVVFLNGRISEKSREGYLKVRSFLSKVLSYPDAFGMQSEPNLRRIIDIGAPPEKATVIGNLKFEAAYQLLADEEPLSREEFGLAQDELVLIGGSTFGGEEEMLLDVYDELVQEFPNLRLILAPRHPQRFEEAKDAIVQSAHQAARRSEGKILPTGEKPIVLLDVMGELKRVYRFADVVFIGKSMGFTQAGCGGQNPLEAAAYSKPILSGPRMENFQEIVDGLVEVGGIQIVISEAELLGAVRELLRDPGLRESRGRSAYAVIGNALGAADRGVSLVEKVLEQRREGLPPTDSSA